MTKQLITEGLEDYEDQKDLDNEENQEQWEPYWEDRMMLDLKQEEEKAYGPPQMP